MSRHALHEPADDDARLAVPVTSGCFTHWAVHTDGVARLVINYGGAELILEAVAPEHAEPFAFDLARVALAVAGHCRGLLSPLGSSSG